MAFMRTIEENEEKFFIDNRQVSPKEYLAKILRATYTKVVVASYNMNVDGKKFAVVQF